MARSFAGWPSCVLAALALAAPGPGARPLGAAEGGAEPVFVRHLDQDGRCGEGLDPDCLVTAETPRVSVVRLRLPLLLAIKQGSAQEVQFNVFPDVRLHGWVQAPEARSDGSLRWRAGLVGDALASVVIVASAPGEDGSGRRVALLIRSPRQGSFDLRPHPADGRFSMITSRDATQGLPCGVGRNPGPSPSAGNGGSGAGGCGCCGHRGGLHPGRPTLPVRPPPYVGEPGWLRATPVSLLLLYTRRTALWADRTGDERAIQATLQAHADLATEVLLASDARTELNVVGKLLLDHASEERHTIRQIWSTLRTRGDGVLDDAHRLRNARAADLVALVVRKDNALVAGWGDVYPDRAAPAERPAYAFSVVRNVALGDDTLAHELGHGLGCCHTDASPNPPCTSITYRHPFPFTDAQGQAAVTLLGVWPDPAAPDDPPRVRYPRFSNPDLRLDGVAIGDRTYADNARMIRGAVATVARYR